MPSVARSQSSATPSHWTAPPAASWTREEIRMIQELFLADENVLQIRNISIRDGRQSSVVIDDPLVVSIESEGDATSMLLAPIEADGDPFIVEPHAVDAKEATTAFVLEVFDPFQTVVKTPEIVEKKKKDTVSTKSPVSHSTHDHVLAQLRAKVETLDRIYYARCMQVSSVDGVSLRKVKLLLAIERLERVIRGLAQENEQLQTDSMSYAQRCDLLLQKSSSSNSSSRSCAELQQQCQSIGESVCAVAVGEGMATALHCSFDDGEVLRDQRDKNGGWQYKSLVAPDGLFTYSLTKTYPKEVNMHEAMQKSWGTAHDSESLSRIYDGAIQARVVKHVGKKAVVVYDMANHDATRVDRVVAVLFQAQLSNGFLLGVRSVASSASTAASKGVRSMDCTMWQRFERKKDSGFVVTCGGRLAYPSRADIEFLAVEIWCRHLRWETSVLGGLQLLR